MDGVHILLNSKAFKGIAFGNLFHSAINRGDIHVSERELALTQGLDIY